MHFPPFLSLHSSQSYEQIHMGTAQPQTPGHMTFSLYNHQLHSKPKSPPFGLPLFFCTCLGLQPVGIDLQCNAGIFSTTTLPVRLLPAPQTKLHIFCQVMCAHLATEAQSAIVVPRNFGFIAVLEHPKHIKGVSISRASKCHCGHWAALFPIFLIPP